MEVWRQGGAAGIDLSMVSAAGRCRSRERRCTRSDPFRSVRIGFGPGISPGRLREEMGMEVWRLNPQFLSPQSQVPSSKSSSPQPQVPSPKSPVPQSPVPSPHSLSPQSQVPSPSVPQSPIPSRPVPSPQYQWVGGMRRSLLNPPRPGGDCQRRVRSIPSVWIRIHEMYS